VWPSAGCASASFAAIMPAAPVLFSTTTGWPSEARSLSAIRRAGMSLGPPAGKPTTMRTWREGNSCAWTANEPSASSQMRGFMLQYFMANPLDLRAWLDEIRKLGELREVRGADCNLELGAISELNVKKDAPPALLFDEIAGYPKGWRVLTCSTRCACPRSCACRCRRPTRAWSRRCAASPRSGSSVRRNTMPSPFPRDLL
jgi:hypothetical protein